MVVRFAVPDLISPSYFPVLAAVALGQIEDGIDSTVQLIYPVSATFESLRNGSVDFAAGCAHAPLYAFPKWNGCKLVCALSQNTYWFLVARADCPSNDEDLVALRGYTIGAAPGPADALTRMLLEGGIDPSRDVRVVPLTMTGHSNVSFGLAAAEALEKGLVDAFWANGMAAEIAVGRGIGKVLVDARTSKRGVSRYTFPALATTDRRIAEAFELVGTVVRAIRRAQRALSEDPTLAEELSLHWFSQAEARLMPELIRHDAPFYQAQISQDMVRDLCQFSAELGLGDGSTSYTSVVARGLESEWK
jgi:NitT/TauT family transport system substrate-binding protein